MCLQAVNEHLPAEPGECGQKSTVAGNVVRFTANLAGDELDSQFAAFFKGGLYYT